MVEKERISSLKLVEHFELILEIANEGIANLIWDSNKRLFENWYGGRPVQVDAKSEDQISEHPKNILETYKLVISNRFEKITISMRYFCSSVILSYFKSDSTALTKEQYYQDFIFFLQHDFTLIEPIIVQNPGFWQGFCGKSAECDYSDEQLVSHFLLLVRVKRSFLYRSMWEDNPRLSRCLLQLDVQKINIFREELKDLRDPSFKESVEQLFLANDSREDKSSKSSKRKLDSIESQHGSPSKSKKLSASDSPHSNPAGFFSIPPSEQPELDLPDFDIEDLHFEFDFDFDENLEPWESFLSSS